MLSKKKYIKIFAKYNFDYNKDIFNLNDNDIFMELCKIPNINGVILNNCIETNKNLDFEASFGIILKNFKNSDNKNITNSIENIKYFIKHIEKNHINILRSEINEKLKLYNNDKVIYSSLKSLSIYINKNFIENLKKIRFKISKIIDIIKMTDDHDKILLYVNKISNYLIRDENLDYNIIIESIENILYNKEFIKTHNMKLLLSVINKCKEYGKIVNNDLEKILLKCDSNIYNYIYFLNNSNNLLIEKELTINFLFDLGYKSKSFKEIDNLKLKRGFIHGLTDDNKDYLLKYQPNKSLMELVLNTYLNVLNIDNFLIPKLFFINNDNSYFYIIEKYNTDLYKYFNILESKSKILTFEKIIFISFFIINSIEILHKNNIIHSDLKPENIVLNLDENNEISNLKIIDFDVGLFDNVPQSLNPLPEKYNKAFNNKKPRGTRIYMLKNQSMAFKNDIFSLGVILLILLYKNIKLLIGIQKKILVSDAQKNRRVMIKFQNLVKKLNNLRDDIENNESKIKILNLIDNFVKKYNTIHFFNEKNSKNFDYFKNLIIDCIETKLDIYQIKVKYAKLFQNFH